MDSARLRFILSKRIDRSKCKFLGVFPRDLIPNESDIHYYPSCFVSNTDSSKGNGIHWVAFYFSSPSQLDFFDSLGKCYLDYGFNKFHLQYPNLISVSLNYHRLQSNSSSVCGHYCVYFLLCRASAHPLFNIINSFSFLDTDWNDYQMYRFFKRNSLFV